MKLAIGCIVEGHGEVESLPILLRRIAKGLDVGDVLDIPPPLRKPRSFLLKPTELERAVEFVARRIRGAGAILIVLDADDDCPAILAPRLLARARQARGDLAVSVVLAKREMEAWFLAASDSIRGHRGLSPDLVRPSDPEGIRGAKEWLSHHMAADGPRYSPRLDQPKFAAQFDLAQARSAQSFDKCYREVERLLRTLKASARGAGAT